MNSEKLATAGLIVMALTISTRVQAEESSSAASQPSMTPAPMDWMMSDDQLKKKQDHLLKMHDLSNKILIAKDPKEKQRLMDEQLTLMREHQHQHHQMMQQHMQEMMKNRPGMPMMPSSPQTITPEVSPVAPK